MKCSTVSGSNLHIGHIIKLPCVLHVAKQFRSLLSRVNMFLMLGLRMWVRQGLIPKLSFRDDRIRNRADDAMSHDMICLN